MDIFENKIKYTFLPFEICWILAPNLVGKNTGFLLVSPYNPWGPEK